MARILVLGVGGGAAALLGTIPAEGLVDPLLLATAAGVSALTGLAARERRRIDVLPLVLAENAVRGSSVGRQFCAFRAWLGRGRVVRSPAVEVCFYGEDGLEQKLEAVLPTEILCGPWTFLVPDPGTAGRFTVRVSVREGGRDWEALGEWDRAHIELGRFAPPVSKVGGRLQWSRDTWNEVEESQR